jgi:hypothetical protein
VAGLVTNSLHGPAVVTVEFASGIVVFSGTMTFANEWYQTKQINWRVPVATLLLGAAFDGLSKLDNQIANMLAVMVFIGAGSTEFNGKSAFDTLANLYPPGGLKAQPAPKPVATTTRKA